MAVPEASSADAIQYMQTVRDDDEEKENLKLSSATDQQMPSSFASLIDPPRRTARSEPSVDFESDDDEDYQLSTSSSSDDEGLLKYTNDRRAMPSETTITPSASSVMSTNSAAMTPHKPNGSPLVMSQNKASDPQTIPKRTSGGMSPSFMDVLNEILEDQPEIPAHSKLGPKPWLMRQGLPKPKMKYEISKEPFVYKPKGTAQTKRNTKPNTAALGNTATPVETLYAAPHKQLKKISTPPPSDQVTTSAGSGKTASANEKSINLQSEADTGFGSNTSSSPGNSSSYVSRLPFDEEKTVPSKSTDAQNAHELTRAALQALSLSKNILQGLEKGTSRENDSIYDEVPFSPAKSEKKNVYDDVPPPNNDAVKLDDGKRTVISVPIFKPPPPPVRNDKNHPMSSESIYDITRSSTQTPTNVSSGAMDLMYQLFGKDLTGTNSLHRGRPSSVKSVTFEDDAKGEGDVYSSRPSSRAGSVCSEWSDCTLNISEYQDSEATTLPRTVDFPQFPQVGFQNLPRTMSNNSQPPRFAALSQTLFGPNPGQFHPPNPNFPYNNSNAQNNFGQSLYQPVNTGTYRARNPMFRNQFPSHAPNPNLASQGHLSLRGTVYDSLNPYASYHPVEPPRPPMHALSPPRSHYGGLTSHDQHTHHHPHSRGRDQDRGAWRRKAHSHSRTRQRKPSYSDDQYYSRSPSPIRNYYRDVIAGKSYIDGYKAALKDAVLTFAEKQTTKRAFTDDRKRTHRIRRRVLSASKIDELSDDVLLGDIRRALAVRSYSDDDYDDDTDDDFLLPSAGRPLSRNGSKTLLHEDDLGRRRRPQDSRYHGASYDAIDDRRYSSDEEHNESCDCSECEGEFEARERFHEGELTRARQKRCDVINPSGRRNNNASTFSPRMKGLRQRFKESLEDSSSNIRAPVRANQTHPQDVDAEYDIRSSRAAERRSQNFEEVRPRQAEFRNDSGRNYRGPADQTMPYPHQQGGRSNNWERLKRVQFGY